MSTPTPCDSYVFENGQPVMIVDTGAVGGAALFEEWVASLRSDLCVAVDWHYSGGRAQVLTTGAVSEVQLAAKHRPLPNDPKGRPMTVLRWCSGSDGLSRAGVDW